MCCKFTQPFENTLFTIVAVSLPLILKIIAEFSSFCNLPFINFHPTSESQSILVAYSQLQPSSDGGSRWPKSKKNTLTIFKTCAINPWSTSNKRKYFQFSAFLVRFGKFPKHRNIWYWLRKEKAMRRNINITGKSFSRIVKQILWFFSSWSKFCSIYSLYAL